MESSWMFVLSKIIENTSAQNVNLDKQKFWDFTKCFIKLFYRKYSDFPKE